jgi:predicted Zn-dependent protease
MPNAFALPGGKVYLLEGLLKKARNPDEVAGVLAHELGHVHNRDNMRKVIQAGGTSFLIGLLFGDLTGSSAIIFVGQTLFDASYTRDAEREADRFAIETMRKLGRSAKPMGEFLVRITGPESSKTTSIFSSHPLSKERLNRMSADTSPITGPEILSAAEWRALKNICGNGERSATPSLRL